MAFGIDPSLPIPDEVLRGALEQLDRATRSLGQAREDHATGLHEARKAFKKLRALLWLVRSGDREFWHSENARYRDVARTIAGPREASALVETLDRFIADYPDAIASASLDLIRRRLASRRDRIGAEAGRIEPAIDAALAACEAGRDALVTHGFVGVGAGDLAKGATKTLGEWKTALSAARRKGEDEDFHDLRKAVKAHWTHLGLLAGFWQGKARRRRKRVEELGERLGDLNDITVMRSLLESDGIDLGADIDTAPFRKLMKRKAKTLRGACLAKARKLLKKRPRRTRRAFAKAATAKPSATTAPPRAVGIRAATS